MGEAVSAELVHPASRLLVQLRVPGDKSIAHRALMLAGIADGQSAIQGVPGGQDVTATADCLRALGVELTAGGSTTQVAGAPLDAWPSPAGVLDCQNSGTTMRLLSGLLAGSRVRATLTGDASLRRRPMERVVEPLRRMGAQIAAYHGHAPIQLEGRRLQGTVHALARPSAQVKSALLLAGLHAQGQTVVLEPFRTRDHTERLLAAMGAHLRRNGTRAEIESAARLAPLQLSIPGDFSSAAFFLAAAALRPGWSATVDAVGLNPTRTAFLDILERMGASIDVESDASSGIEPMGRVRVTGGQLRAIRLGPDQVAQAIDEIPLVMVLATQAQGLTVVDGAAELRLKESDRIAAMTDGLLRMGASVRQRQDSVAVDGPVALHAADLDAALDHRIAMALAVAALVAEGPCRIEGAGSVAVSYPAFFDDLRGATRAA